MKRFNYYLGLMFALVLMTGCHDEFDQPPVYIPVADAVPNMTLAEFKAKHWQESANYVDTVTEDEVIHGWVTANDISNNIYKTIYISDGTASLSISVNQNELYKKYRVGQEIVLPMKGHYVGKATGQMYVAAPYYYVNKNTGASTLECLNMSSDEMESLVQFNKLPDVSKIDTIDVNISDFQDKFDSETLLKYQGLLVRFKDVEIVEADGITAFVNATESSTNRYLMDKDGNKLILRNSRSADFSTELLPLGRHDIVGILGFYQTGSAMWQFYLRTFDDIIGEGKKGTKTYPYSVADAIAAQNSGEKGWIDGYIVGAVGPEVTTVSSNSDIEWKAPTHLDNTIVIADDPDCKDYTKCLIVPLPQGSPFREDANLKNADNSNVYKAHLKVLGVPATYMGAAGVTGNTGSSEEYEIDVAMLKLNEQFSSSAIPGRWTNIDLIGSKLWSVYAYSNVSCAQIRPLSSNTGVDSWLITPRLDIKKAKSKVFNFTSEVNNVGNNVIEVYLLNTNDPRTATVKVKLNPILPSKPSGKTYSDWTPSGDIDLSDWADGEYYIGFNFSAPAGSNYTTWCIDDVTFGMGDPAPADNRADFESMGPKLGEWGTYVSKKGWTATNCMLLKGSDVDNNPEFKFIGLVPGSTKTYAVAPTMNGNTTSVGKIVSPVLKGGMKGLKFNYGYAFSGKVISFRVDVKQNGNVIKSWEVGQQGVTKYTIFNFEEYLNVSGDFTIEFTNLCPSNAASEKDRLSIWNVEWEQ
ncbi:MAG: choice-of-anchor J domain-containing protein [Muribaculaceae bacterium]|nr:choice-of-anchor J domain-containing protein [Muribaculaceae bacterium]